MFSILLPEFSPPCVRAADMIQTGARRPACPPGDIHLACTFPLEEAGEVDLMGTARFSGWLSFLAPGAALCFGLEPLPGCGERGGAPSRVPGHVSPSALKLELPPEV